MEVEKIMAVRGDHVFLRSNVQARLVGKEFGVGDSSGCTVVAVLCEMPAGIMLWFRQIVGGTGSVVMEESVFMQVFH